MAINQSRLNGRFREKSLAVVGRVLPIKLLRDSANVRRLHSTVSGHEAPFADGALGAFERQLLIENQSPMRCTSRATANWLIAVTED
ncbi:hypothetical protein [Paraburkholderia sp. MM5477-R1]|uniref:hypothetical protein n=1 Tax=Paraburkholderia sp. MM5477-R1 TaxID=2991062 RepID=UPI003D243E8E